MSSSAAGAAAMQGARRSRLGPAYLLDYSVATFTRASEAAAVDPRSGWAFYDLVTPWRGTNIPRILPDGAILIEGSRTNVLWQNETLNVAPWTDILAPNLVSAAEAAPDGGIDAVSYSMPGNRVGRQQAVTGMTSGVTYTQSAYARLVSGGGNVLLERAVGSISSVSRTPVAAWGRFDHPWVSLPATSGNWGFAGADATAKTVAWWGTQAELGAFPSSPIRTAGAAATRALELCSFLPPATIQSARWQVEVWPAQSAADGNGSLFSQSAAAADDVFYSNISGRLTVNQGGSSRVQSNVLVWSRHQKLTVTFDAAEGSIEVQGATSGNGKVIGTPWTWPSTAMTVGNRPNGLNPFFGVYGRPVAV